MSANFLLRKQWKEFRCCLWVQNGGLSNKTDCTGKRITNSEINSEQIETIRVKHWSLRNSFDSTDKEKMELKVERDAKTKALCQHMTKSKNNV